LLQTSSTTTWPKNITTTHTNDDNLRDLETAYDLDDVLVETQDSMMIQRKRTFDEKPSSTHQSSLDSNTYFSNQTHDKETMGAMRRKFLVLNNVGRLLGNQCLARFTSRCFNDNANRDTAVTSNEKIPTDVQISIKANTSSFSDFALHEHQPIVPSPVSLRKRYSSADDETRKQESQNSMIIPKQESFGTEFFANVLGIDINELKNVMSDRLTCINSQSKGSRNSFSRDTMKSLLTESSSYDTDSTASSSDFDQYSSYSSHTSVSND
jgi:hypothetical protein